MRQELALILTAVEVDWRDAVNSHNESIRRAFDFDSDSRASATERSPAPGLAGNKQNAYGDDVFDLWTIG
jgi:hypothetical protein